MIVRRVTGSGVSVQGLIASIVSIVFVASVVYYLLLRDVRRAFIHARPKNPLFSPPILIGGLVLAVFAMGAYMLQDQLGTPAIAYTVLGLAIGAIVGMLPDADPVARLMGFMLGLLLAFASYVVRGGYLPYTKWWSAAVVLVLLAIITGIAALFRSSTWFVSMLLGAGILYGMVELQFQAAPSAYLASSALAFLSILFSFGIGYMVSTVLGIKLVPASRAGTAPVGAPPAPPPGGTGTATGRAPASTRKAPTRAHRNRTQNTPTRAHRQPHAQNTPARAHREPERGTAPIRVHRKGRPDEGGEDTSPCRPSSVSERSWCCPPAARRPHRRSRTGSAWPRRSWRPRARTGRSAERRGVHPARGQRERPGHRQGADVRGRDSGTLPA